MSNLPISNGTIALFVDNSFRRRNVEGARPHVKFILYFPAFKDELYEGHGEDADRYFPIGNIRDAAEVILKGIYGLKRDTYLKDHPHISKIVNSRMALLGLLYSLMAQTAIEAHKRGLKIDGTHQRKIHAITVKLAKGATGKSIAGLEDRTIEDLTPRERVLLEVCTVFHQARGTKGYRQGVDMINNILWLPALADYVNSYPPEHQDTIAEILTEIAAWALDDNFWATRLFNPSKLVQFFDTLERQNDQRKSSPRLQDVPTSLMDRIL